MPKKLVAIETLSRLRNPPVPRPLIRMLIDSDQIEGYVVPGKKDRRAGGPRSVKQLERILKKREQRDAERQGLAAAPPTAR